MSSNTEHQSRTSDKKIDKFDAAGGVATAFIAAYAASIDNNPLTIPALMFVIGVAIGPYIIHMVRGGYNGA
jgi:hypothetical protein